jgi:hypothetical protein
LVYNEVINADEIIIKFLETPNINLEYKKYNGKTIIDYAHGYNKNILLKYFGIENQIITATSKNIYDTILEHYGSR